MAKEKRLEFNNQGIDNDFFLRAVQGAGEEVLRGVESVNNGQHNDRIRDTVKKTAINKLENLVEYCTGDTPIDPTEKSITLAQQKEQGLKYLQQNYEFINSLFKILESKTIIDKFGNEVVEEVKLAPPPALIKKLTPAEIQQKQKALFTLIQDAPTLKHPYNNFAQIKGILQEFSSNKVDITQLSYNTQSILVWAVKTGNTGLLYYLARNMMEETGFAEGHVREAENEYNTMLKNSNKKQMGFDLFSFKKDPDELCQHSNVRPGGKRDNPGIKNKKFASIFLNRPVVGDNSVPCDILRKLEREYQTLLAQDLAKIILLQSIANLSGVRPEELARNVNKRREVIDDKVYNKVLEKLSNYMPSSSVIEITSDYSVKTDFFNLMVGRIVAVGESQVLKMEKEKKVTIANESEVDRILRDAVNKAKQGSETNKKEREAKEQSASPRSR